MANYLVNHTKKYKLVRKREREITHAIKHNAKSEKLESLAERLREAKIGVFKMEFSRKSSLPASRYEPTSEAFKWQNMSVDDILALYTSNKPPSDASDSIRER